MKPADWKSWVLFAALAVLVCGQVVAFGLFVARSEDFIARRHNAIAYEYSRNHPLPLPATLRFGAGGPDAPRLGDGWNPPDSDGTWSHDRDAFVELVLRDRGEPLRVRLDVRPFLSALTPENRIEVSANGVRLAMVRRDRANAGDPVVIRVPGELTRSGGLHLKLHVDHCVGPLREGTGTAARPHGVLLEAIDIRRDDGRGDPDSERGASGV